MTRLETALYCRRFDHALDGWLSGHSLSEQHFVTYHTCFCHHERVNSI